MKGEKGFALPATMMLLVAFSMLMAAQMMSVQVLMKSLGSESRHDKTFYAADGMIEFGVSSLPDTMIPGDSLQLGSYWFGSNFFGDVWAVRTDTISTDTLRTYRLYGKGRIGAVDSSEVVLDLRIVGEPLWNIPAGFIAAGGLDKNGNSGIINGNDVCGSTTAGLFAPVGSVTQNGNPVDSTAAWLNGDPPIEYTDDIDSALVFPEWENMRNTPTDADYIVNAWFEWPPSFVFTTSWPTVYMNTTTFELTSAHSGRGVIIAPNGLTIGNGFAWEGIILVGDSFIKNGNATLNGSILTGLNMLLGMPVAPSSLGNGTLNFTFNSCAIGAALLYLNPGRTITQWRIKR